MTTTVVPLRYAAEVLVSNVDKKLVAGERPVRLVNYTDVYYNNKVGPQLALMAATATEDQARRFGLRVGDSIITKDSETAEDIAVPTFVSGSAPDMVCGYHLAIVRPRDNVDGRYLSWALQSSFVRGQFSAAANGMTRFGLTYDAIESARVPLPGVETQRRVADFLDDQVARIDNIIAARRGQLELVSAARQAEVISQLLGGGDLGGPAATAWYQDVPAGYPIRPLRAAWQVIDCKHRTPAYVAAGYAVVSPGDLLPAPLDLSRCHRFVDESDYADLADALRRCRTGDIVYSRNASAGTAALVTSDDPFTMGQDVCRITSVRRSQRYLYYLLNFAVAPQLEAVRVGSTFTRINIDEIKSLRVPVPPDSEQERISNDVDRIMTDFDAIVTTGSQQIRLVDELKRSLITAAVTGEFDVSTADGSRVPA